MRALSAGLQALPELTIHPPSLRLRGAALDRLIEHDGTHDLSKTPDVVETLGPTAPAWRSARLHPSDFDHSSSPSNG